VQIECNYCKHEAASLVLAVFNNQKSLSKGKGKEKWLLMVGKLPKHEKLA